MAKKRGGQSKYTPQLAAEICCRIAMGETLREVCRSEGMPSPAAVCNWHLDDIDGFSKQYARARELQAMALADQALERARSDAGTYVDDLGNTRIDAGRVNRDRLFCDHVKWHLSKIMPKIYGDKVSHEVTGRDGSPVEIRWAKPEEVKNDG